MILELVNLKLSQLADSYVGEFATEDMLAEVHSKANRLIAEHGLRCDVSVDKRTCEIVFTLHDRK